MKSTHCLHRKGLSAQDAGSLYPRLERRAHQLLGRDPAGSLLPARDLVHEAWLRLPTGREFNDDQHLFACLSQAMRCVLVDDSRRKNRIKRRSSGERVPLEHCDAPGAEDPGLALAAASEAIGTLAEHDPLMAEAVQQRLHDGPPLRELARRTGLHTRTFQRRWRHTREWLHSQLIG